MGIWIDVNDPGSSSDPVFVQEYSPSPGEVVVNFDTPEENNLYKEIFFRPGMRILLGDFVLPEGMNLGFEVERAPIELCYGFLGRIRHSISRGRGHTFERDKRPGSCTLCQLPQAHGRINSPPGERIYSLTLFFAAPVFHELFQDWPDALAHMGHTGRVDRLPRTMLHEEPIDPRSLMILNQIMRCPYQGQAASLFLQAKVLELVSIKLDALSGRAQKRNRSLTKRELESVHHAYYLMLEQYQSAPSLEDLCRMVGLNRNKLNQGFREVFGDTVFGVVMKTKLCRAWSLLEQSDLSLVEVALETGYKNQASFTTAFCKYFGCTPGSLRRA